MDTYSCKAGIGLEWPGYGSAALMTTALDTLTNMSACRAIGTWGAVPNGTGDLNVAWFQGMARFLASKTDDADMHDDTHFHAPLPSARQVRAFDWQFSAFVHFGPTTFLPHAKDNNCVTNTTTNVTEPIASVDAFDPQTSDGQPATVNTDQWVRTLAEMGVAQICFTAHHSGGFAMWPSQFKLYTIAHSPYGRRIPGADLVRDFVASCRKYRVSPCLYIAPEVDCAIAMRNRTGYFTASKECCTSC